MIKYSLLQLLSKLCLFVYIFIVFLLAFYIHSNFDRNERDFYAESESEYTNINLNINRNPVVNDLDVFLQRNDSIWPDENRNSDRILEQLNFVPKFLPKEPVVIYLPSTFAAWNLKRNENVFESSQCKVQNCALTDQSSQAETARAVLYKGGGAFPLKQKPLNQIWIMYLLENPHNTPKFNDFNNLINYSASYRYDSHVVTPYEKFVYSTPIRANPNMNGTVFASGKTKQVAWFVSNCNARNRRDRYAGQLGRVISVDVFGMCGKYKCPRRQSEHCFELLKKQYKFYLSFENANCRDYVTEKFFLNGLQNDVIPIVMGASKIEYQRISPPNSFIHVDDFRNVQELGAYLQYLDKNDTAYDEYFAWKRFSYEFINTKFWCRLCALLNEPKYHVYANFDEWWRGDTVCR